MARNSQNNSGKGFNCGLFSQHLLLLVTYELSKWKNAAFFQILCYVMFGSSIAFKDLYAYTFVLCIDCRCRCDCKYVEIYIYTRGTALRDAQKEDI